mmetsp:Transcript_10344/g.28156  ORF Transcript_10344/g.28156 Transcript_10344/m.28156 type:complete len:311 (+) Transcript_10344:1-933(+)
MMSRTVAVFSMLLACATTAHAFSARSRVVMAPSLGDYRVYGVAAQVQRSLSTPRAQVRASSLVISSGITAAAAGTSLALNSALVLFALVKEQNVLTQAGLFHAWILGVVLWATLGAPGWILGVVYLILGSAVTKIQKDKKEALGIAEGRGGRRGPENVWGSAAAGTLCALAYCVDPSMTYKVGFVASFATKLSDTFASEIGKAYGKTTYLITNFKKVPPGTEGAVSLEGTLAGVVGSILIAGTGYLLNLCGPLGFALCLVAAFIATNCESVIGAVFQDKVKWLTNEVVNFINTAIGALVAMVARVVILGA